MSFLKHFRDIPLQCSDCSTKYKKIKRKKSTFIPFFTKICPRCHNENMYQSKRKGIGERVMSYVGINPYRCSKCYWRTYSLKANLMKKIIWLASIAIVLVLAGYFTFSIKNGSIDFIALDTKTDFSVANLTHPEEEELTINEATLEKVLHGENKANILAKGENETSHDNFTADLKKDEAVPVPPKPKEIIVPKDSFKYVEKEVVDFIEGWKVAWQNSAGKIGDMETYLANYTKDFTSDGVPKERWQQKKRKNNRKKLWINIQLSDVLVEKIAGNSNQVKVSFMQEYNSSNYSDKSQKVLILSREDLNWLISKENTVK